MDETQRFIMEVVNAEKIERLTKLLEAERATLQQLNEQLRQGAINQAQFAAAADGPARAAVQAQKQIDSLRASTRDVGHAALQASHAFQDFAQGGIGGVLNNIPGIIQGLGGPAGLAAAISGVGVAAYLLKEPFQEFMGWATSGSNAIPKVRDALAEMDDELKTTKDRLKELAGGYGLTNEELAEYHRLSAEALKVERDRNAEAERRAGLEKARKEEAESANPKNPEAAAVAKDVMGQMGGADDAVNAARNAMEAESPELKALRAQAADLAKKADQRRKDDPWNFTGGGFFEADQRNVQERIDAAMRAIEGAAKDLVLGARGGDVKAAGELSRLLPGEGFAAATDAGLASAKAAAQSVKDREEWEKREAKRKEDAAKAREKAEADDARLVDSLNQQGRAVEREWRAGMDKEAGREQADADRRAKAEAAANARAAARAPREEAAARDAREGGQIAGIASREFGLEMDDQQTRAVLNQARRYVGGGADPGQAARAAIAEMVQGLTRRLQAAEGALQGIAQGVGQMRGQMHQGPATGNFVPTPFGGY